MCGEDFPYRETLNKRDFYLKALKMRIGQKDSKFCGRKCFMIYRNKYENPSKGVEARKRISERAKKKGCDHMHTPEARAKQIKSITGAGHWNWQGGKTPENRRRRNLAEYQVWRKSVFERDDYTCQACGARNGKGTNVYLQAHHIKPWALHPELRLDITNGQTLCTGCHRETDTYMGKLHKYRNDKCN